MEIYTHMIWDFNGTILDDVEACIKSANRLLGNHGLPLLHSIDAYRSCFGFPIIDYYRRLGFDFEKISYADLAVEWVAYYLEYSAASALYPDVEETLAHIQRCGVSQLILSATELGMLGRQVKQLGIRSYFDDLLGLSDIHAYSKEEIGLRWIQKCPNAKALMVGDTDHDARVAAAMGIDCVLLARGHQDRAALERMPCLFVADSLQEIIPLFSSSSMYP